MTILLALGCVLSGLVAAVWISRHVMISVERRRDLMLTDQSPSVAGEAPRITVVVAAKDEAENIEACVRSMLAQDYPNFRMVVANDRSTDGTGQIVRLLEREDERLRLLDITDLPDGWCGKNNAMQTAIASTDSEWICMIDADCVQTSGKTLSVAMRYALDSGADLLSVLPNLEMKGFWENVVQPVCGGIMMIWFLPDKVNSPARPNAYANGAFMLIRRSAYQAVGTHEAVRSEVNEDMHMAANVKRAGLRLRVIRNRGLYRVRMYTSLRQIVRGWGRIFYGTFGTLRRIGISLAVLTVMSILPYLAAALGLGAAALGAGGWALACGLTGSAAVMLQVSVIYRFYKLIGARKSLAWTYVLGCAMAFAALCISLSKLRKGAKVTWRGTSYNSASRAGGGPSSA
jgi:cellulose synthase/poly-beta-1,6-N-acetylglucosamine synthase-like glycosyltransferase